MFWHGRGEVKQSTLGNSVLITSVARKFLSEIADFRLIYRQIRQVFSPKSRKIRQILGLNLKKMTPYSIFIAFLYINIFQKSKFRVILS